MPDDAVMLALVQVMLVLIPEPATGVVPDPVGYCVLFELNAPSPKMLKVAAPKLDTFPPTVQLPFNVSVNISCKKIDEEAGRYPRTRIVPFPWLPLVAV